jgi:LysM repeat protein
VYALFARLERYVFPALVALALWAAVLVAVPAAAQAQVAQAPEKATSNKANTLAATEQHFVVVDPGDTLWSISAEVLRPNAAPRRIAAGAERIYALNRGQIGPDPNLIFAGQRLSVPPALSGPPVPEPSTSGRSAGTQPAAREAAKEASAGVQAGRQAKHETLGAQRQAAAEVRGEDGVSPEAASKPAPLPDAAQAAPVPEARQNVAEEPPRPAGESFSFVGEARAAVAGAASAIASAIVGAFSSAEGHEGYTWSELLGAALLAVSSVAFVLTFVLAFALVLAPKRARRSQQEDWWRVVHANSRAYERASFASSDEGLENGGSDAHAGTNGAHTNGAHTNGANGNVPMGMILAAKRKRARLRRRGRPRSPARHVRRGLTHGAYSPKIRLLLRGASGIRSRRLASRASASRGRSTAAPSGTGVRGR